MAIHDGEEDAHAITSRGISDEKRLRGGEDGPHGNGCECNNPKGFMTFALFQMLVVLNIVGWKERLQCDKNQPYISLGTSWELSRASPGLQAKSKR